MYSRYGVATAPEIGRFALGDRHGSPRLASFLCPAIPKAAVIWTHSSPLRVLYAWACLSMLDRPVKNSKRICNIVIMMRLTRSRAQKQSDCRAGVDLVHRLCRTAVDLFGSEASDFTDLNSLQARVISGRWHLGSFVRLAEFSMPNCQMSGCNNRLHMGHYLREEDLSASPGFGIAPSPIQLVHCQSCRVDRKQSRRERERGSE